MFKDMLKYLRLRENFSQAELAKKLGVSKSTISMYEVGNRQPDFETLENIADLFNVDMNFLLDKSGTENNSGLSKTENILLNGYRKMNQKGQIKLIETARDMICNPLYNDDYEIELKAAHERTDLEVTNEMVEADNTIMDDENF